LDAEMSPGFNLIRLAVQLTSPWQDGQLRFGI
jgi:hypothetical protein